MSSLLVLGTILTAGFVAGQLAQYVRLPKVSGYILCGVFLNPDLFHPMPQDFVEHTDLVTHMALAFITFSVGGSLLVRRIRTLGKTILWITVLEAELALLLVFGAFALVLTTFDASFAPSLKELAIPVSLLVACMASPTDPTATLAVIHENEAKGTVTTTVMGVAALDDVLGIINFSVVIALTRVMVTHQPFDIRASLLEPLTGIAGGIAIGVLFGGILNSLTRFVKNESEGSLIVLIFGLLGLCYGAAADFSVDPLLATMAMGCVVVNFNRSQQKIFGMLERYSEELVFVLFFTLSGMKLELAHLAGAYGLIALFVIFRATGKFLGTAAGATLAGAPTAVKRYAFLGLLPQGGVVIGLTLALQYEPGLSGMADSVLAIVIGATIVHELVGPAASRLAVRGSGEATSSS